MEIGGFLAAAVLKAAKNIKTKIQKLRPLSMIFEEQLAYDARREREQLA